MLWRGGGDSRRPEDKEEPQVQESIALGRCAYSLRFPEDRSRDEKETFSWVVLKPVDFNREVHLGWRFDAAQLAKEQAH